jgi:hypothetical protein
LVRARGFPRIRCVASDDDSDDLAAQFNHQPSIQRIILPSREAERLAEIARDNAVHLVVGVIEQEAGTLQLYGLTRAPSGRLLANIAS